MQPSLNILEGRKFAVLALSECRAGPSPSPVIDFGDGFAVSDRLPPDALQTWESQLGTIHRDELQESRLFLWALRSSKVPQVLDEENQNLQAKVYLLYLGTLLATPYFRSGRMTSLTGAATDAGRVRSLSWYSQTFYTLGSPLAPLTSARLRDAHLIARALVAHSRKPSHRMVRALKTFRHATESSDLDVRLHQFVRVIEAFLAPPFGRSAHHFGQRFARINGGRGEAIARECYLIRSAIEHLRGPFDGMVSKPAGGKHRRLIRRTIEAETIARYMLFTYFMHRELWPHFKNRTATEELWSKSVHVLEIALGDGIPLSRVARAIDWSEVEPE